LRAFVPESRNVDAIKAGLPTCSSLVAFAFQFMEHWQKTLTKEFYGTHGCGHSSGLSPDSLLILIVMRNPNSRGKFTYFFIKDIKINFRYDLCIKLT